MSFCDWVVQTLAGSHLVPNGRAVRSWSASLSLVWTLRSLSSPLPFKKMSLYDIIKNGNSITAYSYCTGYFTNIKAYAK